MTQLYTVPPYACAFVVSLIGALFSDRYHCRGVVCLASFGIALPGYCLFYATNSDNAKYGALFLQIIGTYTLVPAVSTWMANNSSPHITKASAIAAGFVGSNAGGILSSWLYDDAPAYKKGTIVGLVFCCVGVLFTLANLSYLIWQNKKKADKRQSLEKEGLELDVKEMTRLGDRSPRMCLTGTTLVIPEFSLIPVSTPDFIYTL